MGDQKNLRHARPSRISVLLMRCILSGGWLANRAYALPKEFSIDPRRHLTGVSMGGHAVWVVMAQRPGLFAAAVPVCSGGDPRTVTAAAAKFPVWAFHSDDDHLVPVQQARDLVKAWRDRGGTAKYTEYTGLKHSSWKKAYVEPALFDWLFAQRLP